MTQKKFMEITYNLARDFNYSKEEVDAFIMYHDSKKGSGNYGTLDILNDNIIEDLMQDFQFSFNEAEIVVCFYVSNGKAITIGYEMFLSFKKLYNDFYYIDKGIRRVKDSFFEEFKASCLEVNTKKSVESEVKILAIVFFAFSIILNVILETYFFVIIVIPIILIIYAYFYNKMNKENAKIRNENRKALSKHMAEVYSCFYRFKKYDGINMNRNSKSETNESDAHCDKNLSFKLCLSTLTEIYDFCVKRFKHLCQGLNIENETIAFLYVIMDLAVIETKKDRVAASKEFLKHFKSKYNGSEDYFDYINKRARLYGDIINSKYVRGDMAFLDKKYDVIYYRVLVIFTDFINDTNCIADYENAPKTIRIYGILESSEITRNVYDAYKKISVYVEMLK